MSHDEARNIMALVEQYRQNERRVANCYMVLAALIGAATLAMLFI